MYDDEIEACEAIIKADPLAYLRDRIDSEFTAARVIAAEVVDAMHSVYERVIIEAVEGGATVFVYGHTRHNLVLGSIDAEFLRYPSLDAMKEGLEDNVAKRWLR